MKELVESEQQPAETAREIMSLQKYCALIAVDPSHTLISSRIRQHAE